jgi:SAM-dependent methyltransferase
MTGMSEGIVVGFMRNQLLALAPLRRRRDRRRLDRGYEPAKNSIAYVTWVFDNLSRNVVPRRPISGTVLEIGPGGNVGTAILFLEAGAERAVCIDVFPFLSQQDALYDQLAKDPAILERVEYRCPDGIETTTLLPESFDIIYSSACLEHVRDPVAASRRIAALLKPGGVTTHGIDLRDHRDFDDPLDFLRYPDWLWHGVSSRRTYTNRWRASDWKLAFEKSGLRDIQLKAIETVDVTGDTRQRLHRTFQRKPLDDLALTQIEITATKP